MLDILLHSTLVTVHGASFKLSFLKWLIFPNQREKLYLWYAILFIMSGILRWLSSAKDFLIEKFQDRVISRGTPIIWPAHYPDLNPLEIHFWGLAQQQVYQEHSETIESMIDCVKSFAARYDSSVIERVAANVVKRAKLCLDANGGHFQHLLK